MMSIVLFAMIGAMLDAGVAYWIIFGCYCVGWFCKFLINLGKQMEDKQNG